jgi:mono/diheme cytochrome c family protein
MNIHRLLLVALLVSAAGCTVAPGNPPAPIASTQSLDVRAGGKLFARHCSSCHGAGAQGGRRAPSLQTPSVQGMSDAALVRFLTNGDLRKGMPSWSGLPPERRWQLVRYVKSLSPPASQAP